MSMKGVVRAGQMSLFALAAEVEEELAVQERLIRARAAKMSQNYLREVMDDGGIVWLYEGCHNLSRTLVNFVLNPDEVIPLHVGVRRMKKNRDERSETFDDKSFVGWVNYLIGMGQRNLGKARMRKIQHPQGNYRFLRRLHHEEITARLELVPDEERSKFMRSAGEDLRTAPHNFSHPENSRFRGIDSHCWRFYTRGVVKMIYG